jgi:hypothetical protein
MKFREESTDIGYSGGSQQWYRIADHDVGRRVASADRRVHSHRCDAFRFVDSSWGMGGGVPGQVGVVDRGEVAEGVDGQGGGGFARRVLPVDACEVTERVTGEGAGEFRVGSRLPAGRRRRSRIG